MGRPLTIDEIIERFEKANLDENGKPKYIYDKELIAKQYQNKKSIITASCSIHGKFSIMAKYHYRGHGCKECGKIARKEKIKNRFPMAFTSNEERIEKAKSIFGDKYDYTYSDFTDIRKNTKIYCNECKEFFEKSYGKHINARQGCPICFNKNKVHDKESFINIAKKIHGDIYDYSRVIYINSTTDVEIGCKKCGRWFKMNPNHHIRGQGCKICNKEEANKKRQNTTEKFIVEAKKIYGDTNDYSESQCNGNCYQKNIKIKCNSCERIYYKSYRQHIYNREGCPFCTSLSKLEGEIYLFLESHNVEFEIHKRIDWLCIGKNKLTIDFYLPKYNIGIECQGRQHFEIVELFGGEEEFRKVLFRDNIKRELCKLNNLQLLYYSNLHIDYPYFVYEDKEKMLRDIIHFKQ